MDKIRTAAIYVRVSTDDQTEYSPDSQIKLCKKYALEHDIDILKEHIYQEDGISGKNVNKRTAFQEMITNARKKPKPFDLILVYSFSRFARNKVDSVVYKKLLRKDLGIEVISITQPLGEGKESIILESMYEAMDEYYSLDLAENSLRGKIEKASRGEHLGNPPYGYIYNKNTKLLEIDKEKAIIVKLVFNEWIKPKVSIRNIVLKLNKMGIKTTRGCSWADRSLHIILRNPAYIGMTRFCLGGMKRDWYNPNIKVVQGKHESIISKEVWEKAQTKIKAHDEFWFRYKKPQVKHEHWLRGIVHCSSCGKTLVKIKVNTERNNKPTYFQCTWYTKGRCQESHYIKEEYLVSAILEEIKNTYTDKIAVNIAISNRSEDTNEYDILENQLLKFKSRLNRIEIAYQDGIDTLEEYKEKKNNTNREIIRITEELNRLNHQEKKISKEMQIYESCRTAYKILSDHKADENIKSNIAHSLFDNIIFDRKNNSLKITYK